MTSSSFSFPTIDTYSPLSLSSAVAQESSVRKERTMSDQDEALLDEDLGDEEYDLGNDEEEALLADDYEVDRQNSYKGEEETDDVLDLGVTDALDDLEGEDENIEYRSVTDNHNHSDFYKEERSGNHGGYYDQEEHEEIRDEQYEDSVMQNESGVQNLLNMGDLREKLQKNVQRKVFVGNGQGLEDDDCDEAEERRNRFQNERIMMPPKMNNEIPDSLENVVTVEQVRQQVSFRGRGRGRGIRGIRGGRFAAPNSQGNYIPRFNPNMHGQPSFNEQKVYQQPLLDGRPPMYPRVPSNNMMNQQQQQQQLMYLQNTPQLSLYMQNVPPQSGGPHFAEPRPPFNPNQFPGPQGMPQGPRIIGGSRLEYRPRGPMPGPAMHRYNCPPGVPPYMQNQPPHFQTPIVPGNQGPSLLGNPGLPLPGNQGPPGMHGNPGGPPIPVNQGSPMQENSGNVMMQNFSRISGPNQGLPRPNQPPMPNQPPFDQRPNFQDPALQGRPMYDSRPHYNNQPHPPAVRQINNSVPVSIPPQTRPHVPNVPLPPGHKILINPHFRGAVQPTADARLAWDSQPQQQQQPPPQHQPPLLQPPQHQPPQHQQPSPGDGFAQPPAPYQNQGPYGQSAVPPQQQASQEYQQNYQPVKSDDPYAYFSDVWQENKAQKPQITNKPYPTENSYSRDSSYSSYGSKYGKSESTWEHRDSYQEDQRGSSQSYREREPPPRPRSETIQRRVPASNNSYHNEPYDEKPSPRPTPISARPAARPPVKRSPETHERAQRPLSPKRVKIMSNRQEFRSTTVNENVSVKKEEDMDPEMREYRKKMEEQKRLREQILQEKENRRKQAAMKNNDDETRGNSRTAERVQQLETKPVSVVTGVTKDNNVHPMPPRGRGRPANAQATEGPERAPGVRIVRAIQTVESAKSALENPAAKDAISANASVQVNERGRPLIGQPGTRRVVIHKPLPNTQKVATSVQKTVSNLQRPQASVRFVEKPTGQVTKGILKKVPIGTGQKAVVNANRIIVQELSGPLRDNTKDLVKANVPKVIVNTQNNQRVVLQKTTTVTKQRAAELKSNVVRIENLAASTSEAQIRQMCQGIGTLENIHMGEGNATIVFKTQSAALVFHKKYQRKMLDLSLINVHLVQPTSSN